MAGLTKEIHEATMQTLTKFNALEPKDAQVSLEQLKELKVCASQACDLLDNMILHALPSRETIQKELESLSDFKDVTALFETHLIPMLSEKVEKALEAEVPFRVLSMLAPILQFFNSHQSKMEGSEEVARKFIQHWAELLGEGLSMMGVTDDFEIDATVFHELLSAVQNVGIFEDDSLNEAAEQLEGFLRQYEEDGQEFEEYGGEISDEEEDGGVVRGSSEDGDAEIEEQEEPKGKRGNGPEAKRRKKT
ncbi:hypothetical protein GUITHDRAFT_161586 [Guillardia theta CCMP2712]|uniref:Uncharacterized protein n=1 Tax=Guillardia theta (strain CCMP2712) TaxID=905079 RepID=L1JTY5_GUITC|nr:hypothetical protein GUITHDRAFT_161586 [Guillardia theta CCMP2712]EKX51665.1 hypothetical protein GUITHDRAFT_161586 [Guillardia theta CCMP2712]|eukprot:XP_005838645.1 hypothetical protein GUITHDRAFT_161586 [Guillardia theta CCMP2712]